ncbi:MAG TPA: multicopper oxidase domain-containing protein [Candidatus Thermoplasmatota archaeon]|nr:multicopper oxidase domain-containing protein [Candidatus Thermoplasmatota archaeon]
MFPRQLIAHTVALLMIANFLAGCTTPAADVETSTAAGTGELKEFHLYVIDGYDMEPLPGKRMGFFAFSLTPDGPGSVPGPELRVTEGDRVRVTLHQPTELPHTIHFHGISLPWAMDGVPFMTQDLAFEPSTYVYEFDALETGTYWYHCHVDAPVHVDFGLFGALIIEPRDKAQDPPFDRESTLILHEFTSTDPFNEAFFNGREPTDQRTPAAEDAPDWAQRQPRGMAQVAGFIAGAVTGLPPPTLVGPRDYYEDFSLRYHPYYDTFMINGKSYPETEPVLVKKGETVRIRMINAGQLLHTMHLHGHHFLVTHKDGYNLPAPYYADSLVIGPGERYDVYVKANNPGVWDFHDHGGMWELGTYSANDHAFPGGMSTMLVYEDFEHPGLPKPGTGTMRAGDYLAFTGHGRSMARASLPADAGAGPHAHAHTPAPAGAAPPLPLRDLLVS